jgi:WD40 repeat protein
MTDVTVDTTITGGQIQGVTGAAKVHIENFTIYNRTIEGPAAADAAGEPIPPCPYPGLAYFGPGDADLFFGRSAAVTRLGEAIGRQSLTALVGASGSGKSSVVLAGLAPHLHGVGGWRFSHFRIGTELDKNPFLAVARSLVPLYLASQSDTDRLLNTKQLAENLETGQLTLRDVFADCRSRNKGTRILLIADQFEEAFTLVEDEALRNRFIDLVLAGFTDPAPGTSPEICLILTLRADFYGQALRHRPLADALQGRVENLGPMDRSELQEAICRPAENNKVSFDPGLVETLLDDVENKPGSLPLLQFALREMWGRQQNRKITRQSYDAIGGVEGGLARRAETIFAAMTDNGANAPVARAFQRLFTRLVTLGEGQEDTRRVVDRRELGDEAWSLAQRLAGENNRLVVTNAPAFLRETAEVAHEALIRHWPKLVEWIDRDRTFQSWLRQIRSNVELWSVDPSDDGPLLRGGMLVQASDWLARHRDDLSLSELSYIEASLALQRREEEKQEAARQAEIKRQRELAETAVNLAAERDKTRAQLLAMQARRVQAQAHAPNFIELGGALALESIEIARNTNQPVEADAAEAARSALIGLPLAVLAHGVEVSLLAVLADGRLASGGNDGTIKLWPTEGTGEPVVLTYGAGVRSLAVLADGRLASGSSDGTIKLWPTEGTGQPVVLTHGVDVTSLAVLADGQLASGGEDGTIKLWPTEGTGQPVVLTHGAGVLSLAVLGDGRLASGSSDGTIKLWPTEGTGEPVVLTHGAGVLSLAVLADGRLASGSSDGTIKLWTKEGTGEPVVLPHGAMLRSLAVLADGRLASGGEDGKIKLWAKKGTAEPVVLPHGATVMSLAVLGDGRLASGGYDGAIKLWPKEGTGEPVVLTHGAGVRSLAVLGDGRLASVGDDGAIKLWPKEGTGEPVVLTQGARGLSLAVLGDGRLASGGEDGTIKLWSKEGTGEPMVLTHGVAVGSLAVLGDGRLASVGLDGTIKLWSKEGTGEPVVFTHGGWVMSLAVLADARLASGGVNGTIKLWPNEGIGEPVVLTRGTEVTSLAVLGDGRLASGGDDGTIKLWSAEGTGEAVMLPHGARVLSLAVLADGRLASGGVDGTIKLWPKEGTGEPVVLTHGAVVWSLAVLADGRLASGDCDGEIKLWLVDEQQLVAALCLRAGRNLTKAEWARYIGPDTPWQPSCRDRPSNWRMPGDADWRAQRESPLRSAYH